MAGKHCVVVNLFSAGLDHHYFFMASCHSELQIAVSALLFGRIDNYLSIHKSDIDPGNRDRSTGYLKLKVR